MLFSVVIPTFNRRALLARTLESVTRQTFADFEIIVVDDGSTDGTLEYLRSLERDVRLLRQENKGAGVARNAGASEARGEYIAFLDSDDVWFPWTLTTFAAVIRDYDSPSILSACVFEFRQETELTAAREGSPKATAFRDYYSASQTGFYVGSGMGVFRRDDFLASGGFLTRRMNAEDHDLCLRLGAAAGFVQILAPVTLGWYRHAGGATRDVERTAAGIRHLIEQEHSGAYPGGELRARQRREIICRHVRPVAFECLRQGMRKEAWEFYRATLQWHISQGRWRFLIGFPISALH